MTNYVPLYVGGKRDKTRRYVNPSTGEIISRRQYIKITEGVSPEEKHIQKVKAGKVKPGKTYQRYLERKAKKEKARKERLKPKRKVVRKPEAIPEKWLRGDVPERHRGYYQLQGHYRFRNTRTGGYATAVGFSTATRRKRYGEELKIWRTQAVDHARAKLVGASGEWVLVEILDEVWLRW